MKKIKIVSLFLALMLAITACGGGSKKGENSQEAQANDFPQKDIHIIVPYNAGGGVDITTRVFTDVAKDSKLMNGKSFVVENKGGGGAVVGHTYAKNQPADGYTVLAYTNAIVSNPLLKETTYKTEDFKVLSKVCFDPDMMVVPKDSPFNTLEDVIKAAKEKPLKASTPGHSTVHHMAAEVFASKNGLKFEYLHSDSSAVQMQQIMGGHTDIAFVSVGEATGPIQDGMIKGIAIMSENKIEALPDIPTFKEAGYDMTFGAFRGFAVSKDVPDAEYKALVKIFEEVGSSDALKKALTEAKIPYEYTASKDFEEYVKQYTESVKEILPVLKEAK